MIIYMSKLRSVVSSTMGKLKELTYASVPYVGYLWSAISAGDIMAASPIALAAAAKEHYYQYNELLKDVVITGLYVSRISVYIDYLKTEKETVCNIKDIIEAHKTLAEFIRVLNSDKGINAQLNSQQLVLNRILEEYKEGHDVNKYKKNVQMLSEKIFVKSWPGWYRRELANNVDRLNMLIDNAMLDIADKTRGACGIKLRLNVTAPMPVSMDSKDNDIFYDAMQSPQKAGGRKKSKQLRGRNQS